MMEFERLIEQAYTAFNARDSDAALMLITEDVHWPKASEGGSIIGKQAVREYWTRQWAEFSPIVHPLSMAAEQDTSIRVQVHQVVRTLTGKLLSDSVVTHIYTMRDGLIAAMTLGDEDSGQVGATAAFRTGASRMRNSPTKFPSSLFVLHFHTPVSG